MGTVFKELAEEGLGVIADAGGFGATDLRSGQGLANGGGGEVVEAVVFGGGAVPIADVGLVQDFPEPGCGLAAVAVA